MSVQPLTDLAHAMERRLAAAASADPDKAGALRAFIDQIRTVGTESGHAYSGPARFVYGARRYWPEILDLADPAVEDITGSLSLLAPHLRWHQTSAYQRHPPNPGFLDNYGYAVIAGPADGAPALLKHESVAMGVLLLGPQTHYPLHHHPAPEIYLPLHAAQWRRDTDPWRTEPPGAIIYHRSQEPHATRTGDRPLLALYLWIGDLATSARFVAPVREG